MVADQKKDAEGKHLGGVGQTETSVPLRSNGDVSGVHWLKLRWVMAKDEREKRRISEEIRSLTKSQYFR